MIHSCGILLIDKNKNSLICVPYRGIKNNRGYTVPKGKNEKGESYKDAAIRETLEECGFDVTPYEKDLKFVGKEKYKKRDKIFHGYYIELDFEFDIEKFKCTSYIDGNESKPEIKSFKLVPLDKVCSKLHYVQSNAFQKTIKNIKNRERYAKIRKNKEQKNV